MSSSYLLMIVSSFLTSFLFISCNTTETPHNRASLGSEEPRGESLELDQTTLLIISTELLQAGIYDPGRQVSLNGELQCAYGIGQFDSAARLAQCTLKVEGRCIGINGEDAKLISGRLKKAFVAKVPFELEIYRELKLDFAFTSDGSPRGEKAVVSLKPQRGILLSCKSDGTPRWAMSVKFNDDLSSATVANFQSESSEPAIPSELMNKPELKLEKIKVDELGLLKLELNWNQASLNIQQNKEATTFETYTNFNGKFTLANDQRNILCTIQKNY